MKPYLLISDGACTQNPGPGGYGLILVTPDDQVQEFGGFEDPSTNNRMELMAVLRGLQEVYRLAQQNQKSRTVRMVSDSKYVLENFEKHLENWSSRSWVLSTGGEVKNRDIWERVLTGKKMLLQLGFRFETELVKGHSGHEGNERADQIAVHFSKKETIQLYRGDLKNYPISTQSGAAFTPVYLSYIDGVLTKHPTWPECQKAVEGRAGARYKKVKNSIEERETLKSWGIPGKL